MKEILFKSAVLLTAFLTLLGVLHGFRALSDVHDYNYVKRLAEKNSGLTAEGHELLPLSGKAPAEAMRTASAPLTAEDLSEVYINGIRFDFPCTLTDLKEHFDLIRFSGSYDEEQGIYTETDYLVLNGVSSYRVDLTAPSKTSPPEEWLVIGIRQPTQRFSRKYFPELIIAGMDIYNITPEEYYHLAALDGKEYIPSNRTELPADGGKLVFSFGSKYLRYCRNGDTSYEYALGFPSPVLLKDELRLPENYSGEVDEETKAEVRDLVNKYYSYDDDDESYLQIRNEKRRAMANDVYITAYEFLALPSDSGGECYFEIDKLQILYDLEDSSSPGNFIRVTAKYCEEGSDYYSDAEMIVKSGEPLGSALLIQMS